MPGFTDIICERKTKQNSKITTILQLYLKFNIFKNLFIYPLSRVEFLESENRSLVITSLRLPFLIFENTEQIHGYTVRSWMSGATSCCSGRSNYSCQFFQHEKTTSFQLYKKQIVSIQRKRNNNLYVMNSVVLVKLVNLGIWRDTFIGGCWEEDAFYMQVREILWMNKQKQEY